MGIGDFLKNYQENRGRKAIEKHEKIIGKKNTTEEQRNVAIAELRKIESAEAASALLKRYNYTIEKTIADLEEKEQVHNILVEWKNISVKPVKEYMKRSFHVAWPHKILAKLVEQDELLAFLLHILPSEDTLFDETASSKRLELLTILKDYKDPRITPALLPLLENRDDDVKLSVIAVLEAQADPASRDAMIETFKNEKESVRLQRRIIEAFAALGWTVEGFKKDIEKLLPPGFSISKDNTLKAP